MAVDGDTAQIGPELAGALGIPCAVGVKMCIRDRSYINTRSTGGILAFGIAAAGYAFTAVAIAFVGNRIDKKVRIVR